MGTRQGEASPQGRPSERRATRGTKGSSRDLAATQRWQRVRRRTAAEDRAVRLSPGQGRRAEGGEAQPEREGSCRLAKAVFRFNVRWQGSGQGPGGAGAGHWLHAGPQTSSQGHTWRVTKRPQSPLTRRAGEGGGGGVSSLSCSRPPMGLSHPSPPSPCSGLSSPHPGSQAVPCRLLLRAGEVLGHALYSYLYRAVINSLWPAAATRGGRFCPPATLQRQGLICLKHTPQPFHGDPFQFHGACTALTCNGLIYGSAFQSLPPSLPTLTGGSGETPSPRDVHQGQRPSRGNETGLQGEDAGLRSLSHLCPRPGPLLAPSSCW